MGILIITWYVLTTYPLPARMWLPLSTNGSKGNDSSCKSSWSSDDEFSVVSRCELSSKQARHYCCLLNEKLHKSWWKLKFPPRGGNQNKFDFCYFWYYSHFILFSAGTLLGFLCAPTNLSTSISVEARCCSNANDVVTLEPRWWL